MNRNNKYYNDNIQNEDNLSQNQVIDNQNNNYDKFQIKQIQKALSEWEKLRLKGKPKKKESQPQKYEENYLFMNEIDTFLNFKNSNFKFSYQQDFLSQEEQQENEDDCLYVNKQIQEKQNEISEGNQIHPLNNLTEQQIVNTNVEKDIRSVNNQENIEVIAHGIIDENTYNIKQSKFIDQSDLEFLLINCSFFKTKSIGRYKCSGGEADIFINKEERIAYRICKITNNEDYIKTKEEFENIRTIKKNRNIINYIDAFFLKKDESITIAIFVMEQCQISLYEELEQQKELDLIQCLQIIFDILDGLLQLRLSYIFHSDIKPQNILKSFNNVYVLSDFGTSVKYYRNLNLRYKIKGYTPSYYLQNEQNPELFNDIYAANRSLIQILSFCPHPLTNYLKSKLKDINKNKLRSLKCQDLLLIILSIIIENNGLDLRQILEYQLKKMVNILKDGDSQSIYDKELFLQIRIAYSKMCEQIQQHLNYPHLEIQKILYYRGKCLFKLKQYQDIIELFAQFVKQIFDKQVFDSKIEVNLFIKSIRKIGYCYLKLNKPHQSLLIQQKLLDFCQEYSFFQYIPKQFGILSLISCQTKNVENFRFHFQVFKDQIYLKQESKYFKQLYSTLIKLVKYFLKSRNFLQSLKFLNELQNMIKYKKLEEPQIQNIYRYLGDQYYKMFKKSKFKISISINNTEEQFSWKEIALIQNYLQSKLLNLAIKYYNNYIKSAKIYGLNNLKTNKINKRLGILYTNQEQYEKANEILNVTFAYYNKFFQPNELQMLKLNNTFRFNNEKNKQQFLKNVNKQSYSNQLQINLKQRLNKYYWQQTKGDQFIQSNKNEDYFLFWIFNYLIKIDQKPPNDITIPKKIIHKLLQQDKLIIFYIPYFKSDIYKNLLKDDNTINSFLQKQNYHLIKCIGQGGFGIVYKGYKQINQFQKQECAIKIFDNKQQETEIKLIELIKNPSNIVEYQNHFIFENIYILVLNLAQHNLEEEIQSHQEENKDFNQEDLLQIIFDLIFSLIEIRSYCIIHADIKPKNFLKNIKNQFVLCDFGLSGIYDDFKNGIKVEGGTYFYMSPEQPDQIIDYSSDIYSLGRTFKQLVNNYSNKQINSTQIIEILDQIIENHMLKTNKLKRKSCLQLFIICLTQFNNYFPLKFQQNLVNKLEELIQKDIDIQNDIQFINLSKCLFIMGKILIILSQNIQLNMLDLIQKLNERNNIESDIQCLIRVIILNTKLIQKHNHQNEKLLFQIVQSLLKALHYMELYGDEKSIQQIFNFIIKLQKKYNFKQNTGLTSSLRFVGKLNQLRLIQSDPLQFLLNSIKQSEQPQQQFSSDYAKIQNDISKYYIEQKAYSSAKLHQIQSIDSIIWYLDKNYFNLAIFLNNLAFIFLQQNDYQNSIRSISISLKIIKELIFQKNNRAHAIIQNNISIVYTFIGDLQKSLDYQSQSIKMEIKFGLGCNQYKASVLNNQGIIYLYLNQWEYAEELLFKSLLMYQENPQDNHTYIASCLNNIGLCYIKFGQMRKSLHYLFQSLEIRRKNFERQKIDILQSLLNIFDAFQLMGDTYIGDLYKQEYEEINKSMEKQINFSILSKYSFIYELMDCSYFDDEDRLNNNYKDNKNKLASIIQEINFIKQSQQEEQICNIWH